MEKEPDNSNANPPPPPNTTDEDSSDSSTPCDNDENTSIGLGQENPTGSGTGNLDGEKADENTDQSKNQLPPLPPKLPPPPSSEDTFDEESDWLSNLETIVSEAYNLVADCNNAADQNEAQYLDTIADLNEILKLTTAELLKIDSSAPPSFFRKAVNIRVVIVRHASKASAEIKRRELQLRVKELNIAKREAALNPQSTQQLLLKQKRRGKLMLNMPQI